MSRSLTSLFFLLIAIISFSYSSSEGKSRSLGITSETMGVFGMISASNKISGTDEFHIIRGVSVIPLLGGAGISWKRYFNSSRAKPFAAASIFGTYTLGWCQSSSCDNATKMGAIFSGSLGFDFHIVKIKKTTLNFQLGILSQFDLVNMAFFESPSDRPGIWPIINLKLQK